MQSNGRKNTSVNTTKKPLEQNDSVWGTISSVLGCCARTTVRFFKNLPSLIKNYIQRKYKEYKRKPKRDSISRVYVLVGYTTKKHADERYKAERFMITMRRGLLVLILVLIIIISVNRVTAMMNFEQYKQMFGIGSVDEMTENDPFATDEADSTSVVIQTSQSTSETTSLAPAA